MFGILRRPGGDDDDAIRALLFCLSVPVILIIMVQAFLSEANANWALAAMPALVVWLAGWLATGRRRLALAATGINLGIAAVLLAVTIAGTLGPLTPQSDPLRRLRGWQELANDTSAVLQQYQARIVIADRRATAALLSWHFHDSGITVLVHDADGVPKNHFEQNMAWQPETGRRLVVIDGNRAHPAIPAINWSDHEAVLSQTGISRRRDRTLYLHTGIGAED